MQRKSFAEVECTIARSIEEVGDGWSLMILRNALLGTKRFQDFEQELHAPPTTLARRLQSLTERGFFARREYESHPRREEYELTEKGREFLPVLLSLAAWGGRWLSPGGWWMLAAGSRWSPGASDYALAQALPLSYGKP